MVRATDFTLIVGKLYKMGPDEILRRCVLEHEKPLILAEAHSGAAGGHYAGKAMAQKILTAGLCGLRFIRMQESIATAVISIRS